MNKKFSVGDFLRPDISFVGKNADLATAQNGAFSIFRDEGSRSTGIGVQGGLG